MMSAAQIVRLSRAACPCGHRAVSHGVRGCSMRPVGKCSCWRNPVGALISTISAMVEEALTPVGRVCSQCGERDSAMVKIGTSDGWCTHCLDEAAVGERPSTMSLHEWIRFLDEHRGVNKTAAWPGSPNPQDYRNIRRVCSCGDVIGEASVSVQNPPVSRGPRGGLHSIPVPLSGYAFDEAHRLHISEKLAAL